jgi:3-phenylpropionate/cinnamic acid dioxygenase small subunit
MIDEAVVARFLYREARLLDEKRWDEWYDLFADDGVYWVPLSPDQEDGINFASLAYEDKLLLRVRIERLKSRPFSQQPPSRSQHVLQAPEFEAEEAGMIRTRTPFHYAEARGDDLQMYTGTAFHALVPHGRSFLIRLKRVALVNCDAALPSVQLFL